MHIAICDDNVADRKQLERLLKRESDKRSATTGVLYVDSYGHSSSLLNAPMQYDTFFIDMCKNDITGIEVLQSLLSLGITAPIVMCSSDISYKEYQIPAANVMYLQKPIQTEALSQCLDTALAIKLSADPHIELRDDNHTYYVKEEDILYAVSNGRYLQVKFHNGQTISLLDTISNLFSLLEQYPSFFISSPKALVNGRYVSQISLLSITMTDGKKISLSPSCRDYAKYIFQQFH